ncbi:hypothetical protein GF327_09890 [Candidatus Woesearchaeota archaeon]|nr:hypothetical protein [Candidatus Woesearchaeota archaeon]
MFVDIVFPKNNEKEFIKTAKRLKTKALLFIYPDLKEPFEEKDVKIFTGVKCGSQNKLNKYYKKTSIIISENTKRGMLTDKRVNLFFNFENKFKKDSLHYRRSGINHITAKIISEKQKFYTLSFSNILNNKEDPKLFGRYMQNAMLLAKYRCNVIAASFAEDPWEMRSEKHLVSAAKSLDFSGKQLKEGKEKFFRFLERK